MTSFPREELDRLAEQSRRSDFQIQFIGEPFDPPATDLTVDVPIEVTNAVGVRDVFTRVERVQVNITGGTAPGAQLRQGGDLSPIDGSLAVSLVEGRGVVKVTATGFGDVLLSLTDVGASGLDVSETATVTFTP